VVPCCTELSCPELVLTGSSRSDRAFGDSRDAVILAGVQLSNTVPVDTGSVMLEVVLDIDDDCVTPLCSYEWSRILTVDEHHLLGSTTSIGVGPSNIRDLEVVSHGGAVRGRLGIEVGGNAVAITPAVSCPCCVGASTILPLDNLVKSWELIG